MAEGDVSEKIRLARKYHRPALTQGELADAAKMSRSILASYESGRREPPVKAIERIASTLAVPIDWFFDQRPGPPPLAPDLTGFGSGIGGPARAPSADAHLAPEPAVGRIKFPLAGSAGAASFPIDSAEVWPGDFVEFSEDLYREDRFAIQVSGDSMSPRIEHGDFILVQPSAYVERGLFAVARNAEYQYIVKRYVVESGRPVLRPENPAYDDIEPDGQWAVVGYAVGLRRERGHGRYLEEGDSAGLR